MRTFSLLAGAALASAASTGIRLNDANGGNNVVIKLDGSGDLVVPQYLTTKAYNEILDAQAEENKMLRELVGGIAKTLMKLNMTMADEHDELDKSLGELELDYKDADDQLGDKIKEIADAQGEKGDKGDLGKKGDKGDTGAKGETGTPGAAGTPGTDGKAGTDGTDG